MQTLILLPVGTKFAFEQRNRILDLRENTKLAASSGSDSLDNEIRQPHHEKFL
jgi:hypothetical protein